MRQRRVVAYATIFKKMENLQIVHILSPLPPDQPRGMETVPSPGGRPAENNKCVHRYQNTHARIVGSCYAITHNDRNTLAKTGQVYYTIGVVLHHVRSCVHGVILTCSQGIGGYQPSIPAARYSRGAIIPQFPANCKSFNKEREICLFTPKKGQERQFLTLFSPFASRSRASHPQSLTPQP